MSQEARIACIVRRRELQPVESPAQPEGSAHIQVGSPSLRRTVDAEIHARHTREAIDGQWVDGSDASCIPQPAD